MIAVAVTSALGGAFCYGARQTRKIPDLEPSILTGEPIAASFGFGDGVRFPSLQSKEFDFRLTSPLPSVVLLHFQSKDISLGQVMITANGEKAGAVPADGTRSAELSHEVLIGNRLLKLGESNRIAFVNVGSSIGKQTWRIWNIWADVEPLAQIPMGQLIAEAEVAFRRAQLRFEQREIGIPNRFLAWKDFRSARLLLEAHPEPRPDLYQLAGDRMIEAQRELDRLCSKLILEVQRALSQRDRSAAHSVFEQLSEYFPAPRTSCALWAERRRAELAL